MRDFKELKVWEKAHHLTVAVYEATKAFPADELYRLTSQLRRASSSIASNIAEGCGRNGAAELARFLHIATGSASEVEYRLLLARDLGLLTQSDHTQLSKNTSEIKRMLTALIRKLRPGC